MARRKRRGRRPTKLDHLWLLGGVGLVGYLILVPRYGLLLYVLFGSCALVFWALFLMPTRCDFEVNGCGCRLPANGKARGCPQWHARDKRDTLFAALRMRNPGLAFRVMWLDGANGGRAVGAPPSGGGPANSSDAVRNRGQALYNLASLFVALVAAIAGVLALFVTK